MPQPSSDSDEALRRIEACREERTTHLNLIGLNLSTLPPEIGQLTALTTLRLSHNQLSTLPPEILQLTALTTLDLTHNQLITLPPEICQLTALTTLGLWNNQLSTLPPEIGQLMALTTLNLWDNQLSTLPPEIGRLTALTTLHLSKNQLSTLPPEIGRLTALTTLHLSLNQLSSLPPEIGLLTSLTTLNLWDNELSTLPPEIGQLAALTTLQLSHNQFSTLPPEIGQLTALSTLRLWGNQFSTLPPEISQCPQLMEIDVRYNCLTELTGSLADLPQLKSLMIGGNPLPSELLKLSGGRNGKGTKLLRFLRAQKIAKAKGNAAASQRFNEAKLLLVGPGNVGKTWLLQALQGRVPKTITSTKGIEIAREPLEVDDLSEPGRTLHLTCWDFGGQDHYQVTHQIFFSSKAIYLLVWKPREGFDPEMAARLERIQLSAGRTAKVFIVSTHADGTVHAVLGQEALRERFGDLIGGFFQVDSKKGPQGTGISELKTEIANAAAQLDGMELDFPVSWHSARQEIRKIKEPAVPFKQLVEVCEKHGLDADTADTLARLMDVQGHAVYFPDAANDEDAGSMADENVVVLNPEWLAKAIGFVLEDKQTSKNQGVLSHGSLSSIWKEDAKRDCPGYKNALQGYLLWLMWKFDIAYKQDEKTSLLPEMIARNRPDDLRWTPNVTSRSHEARVVCVFTSELTGKVIASPKGLMPALTAAVHPLRQVRDLNTPDRLDRNWNSGFFLHTQSRGDAYVELNDRELLLVVRDTYPAYLLRQVLQTLDELVPQRWPHAQIDLRVPCPGSIAGKPCPGLFKKEWLEKQGSVKVSCQDCGKDDYEANKLLDGFDPREKEVLERLQHIQNGNDELLDGQRSLMAAAHSIFLALDPENEERTRGPSLFTILPEKTNWIRGMGFDHVRLTCWCEHPDGPHPGSPIGSNSAPDYVLKTPKDWLVKSAPYISYATMFLKAFVPLVGNVSAISLDGTGIDLRTGISLMKDMAYSLPSGELDVSESRDFEIEPDHDFVDTYRLRNRPELIALRHIHDLLEEQIPKPQRWGNLRAVRTKSGNILWLCPAHAAIQEPPPQNI